MGRVLVLYSGGLDSLVLLDLVRKEYREDEIVLLHIKRNSTEFNAYTRQVSKFKGEKIVLENPVEEKEGEDIARNVFYLVYALRLAVERGCEAIYFATHKPNDWFDDYYLDCSPQFVEKFREVTRLWGVDLRTPLLYKDSWWIWKYVKENGLSVRDVIVCNTPREGKNCGECMKCWEAQIRMYALGIGGVKFATNMFEMEREKRLELMRKYPWFDEARLYINNRCDQNCGFCSYRYKVDEDELSDEEWEKVIDILERIGIKRIMISGREPLFDFRRLSVVVNRAKKYGFYVAINTNGNRLREFCELGMDKDVDEIFVSMNKESDLEKVFRDTFIPYIVVHRENMEKVKDWLKVLDEKGVKRVYLRFVYPVNSWTKRRALTYAEQEEYLQEIGKMNLKMVVSVPIDWKVCESGLYAEVMKKVRSFEGNEYIGIRFEFVHDFCMAYWRSITVLHNGDVVGCAKHTYSEDVDRFVVGKIFDKDIREKILSAIRGGNICLQSCI